MHNDVASVLERSVRVLRDRVIPRVYSPLAPVTVSRYEVPGEPVSVNEIVDTQGRDLVPFAPFTVPGPYGGVWTTTWFRLAGRVPAEALVGADPIELVVDLGWFDHSVGGHVEGLVYRPDGRVLKAVHPRNGWVRLCEADGVIAADGSVLLYLEVAANPLLLGLPPFRETRLGSGISQASEPYQLRRAELCRFNQQVWELARDIEVVSGLAAELPTTEPRQAQLVRALDLALDAWDERDLTTASKAREILAPVLAARANASAHQVTAVGHAHIDSAWLWPVRETRRKVGRTVSNVLSLLDSDPEALHVMSAAAHFDWLDRLYPDLFAQVMAQIEAGRFVPVGGMWVESDGMMPTGEAFVRQMTYGLRYFRERLGYRPLEVWLPDSFGYSGALPQLVRRAGYRWFLTQKISWNDTTKFPHHTFWWQGIDGTRVLTHFTPADTYAAEVTATELTHAVANFQDKAISNHSLLPVGYGDGGGGPTREMAARARRFADLEGAPQVRFRRPDEFFRDVEAEYAQIPDAPIWAGELYLERHRGTLTSQVAMKQGNRRAEALLRAAEYLATVATVRAGATYPYDELDALWKITLLNQFHDILPGSSIPWVHREARAAYDEIADRGQALIQNQIASLELPAIAETSPADPDSVSAQIIETGALVLENAALRVEVSPTGLVTSLLDRRIGREVVAGDRGLGELQVFRDEPIRWDAWDIDRHTLRNPESVALGTALLVSAAGAKGVRFTASYRDSVITGTWWLRPQQAHLELEIAADWRTREHLLKVAFPIALTPRTARFETMYGTVERPVHDNTAADEAQFEVCTDRYLYLAEGDFGVGVVNDGTYGGDVTPLARERGTLARISLVRSACFPDPAQDLGEHRWLLAVVPGAERETLAVAQQLNAAPGIPQIEPLLRLDTEYGDVVLDWIKLADDRSGDVIARLYEPFGAPARAQLAPGSGLIDAEVWETNLLEEADLPDDIPTALRATDPAVIELGPFQVATLRFHR